MGIVYNTKTKNKASLKLFNHISSYLFEQEYDELKGKDKVKEALKNASKELVTLIK